MCMYTLLAIFLLSPHPADPTLTTENIIEMVREVESHWWHLGHSLGVRFFQRWEIYHLYQNDHQRLEALVNHYVRHFPTPAWKGVACALERIELHQLAKVVTTKYVRGMWLGVSVASGGYILMCIFRSSSFAFSL